MVLVWLRLKCPENVETRGHSGFGWGVRKSLGFPHLGPLWYTSMKFFKIVTIALLGLTGLVRAEKVSIVQITDLRGQVGFQVMSREEFAALTKAIREETTAFPAVVAECKAEWEANPEQKLPFPLAKLKPRSAKKQGDDFTDRDKAEKKRVQLDSRSSMKELEDLAKEEKKTKQAKPSDEELAKADAQAKAFDDAVALVAKKLGDKLKRPVPEIGYQAIAPK